jgi:hypothetical protein
MDIQTCSQCYAEVKIENQYKHGAWHEALTLSFTKNNFQPYSRIDEFMRENGICASD